MLVGVYKMVVGREKVGVGKSSMKLTDVYNGRLSKLKYKLEADMIRGGKREFVNEV